MTGDVWIRGVRRTRVLQSHGCAARRHLAGGNGRKEPVDEQLVQIVAVKLATNGTSDQTGSLAEDGYRMCVLVGVCEQRLLRQTALMPQGLQLPRVDPVTLALESLLHETCEGEVHVVAAE